MRRLRTIGSGDRFALCGLLSIYAAICWTYFGRYAFDDSYFGYSIAQSMLHGHGFSFNGDDKILSTSAPLAALLYALLARLFNGDVVFIAQCFSAVAFATVIFGTYLLVRRFAVPAGAFFATMAAVCSPFVLPLWSHETMLFLACLICGLACLSYDKPYSGAVVLGISSLFRGEALLILPFAWCALVWMRGFRRATPLAALTVAPFALWTLIAISLLGTPFSSTITAKQAQSVFANSTPYLYGLNLAIMWLYAITPIFVWGLLLKILFLFCVVVAWFCGLFNRAYVLIAGYILAVSALYVALQLPFYLWFCTQIAFALGACVTALWPRQPTQRYPLLFRGGQVASVLLASLNLAFLVLRAFNVYPGPSLFGWIVMPQVHQNAYRSLGEYITRLRAKSVSYAEFGQLHYYSGVPVADYLGIASPHAAWHLRRGNAIWTFKKWRPDLVVVNPTFNYFVAPTEYDWFRRAYHVVATLHYGDDDRRSAFVVYRLRQPSSVPFPDEILHDVRVVQASATRDGLEVRFTPAVNRIAEVEVRARLSHACPQASVELFSGLNRESELRSHLDKGVIRFTMQPHIQVQQASTLFVKRCSGIAIAPPNELRKGFAFFNKWPVHAGPLISAVTFYGGAGDAER